MLNHCTSWRRVAGFTHLLLQTPGKETLITIKWRVGGIQSWTGWSAEEKTCHPTLISQLPSMEPNYYAELFHTITAHSTVPYTGIFLMWDWAGMSTAEQTSSVAVLQCRPAAPGQKNTLYNTVNVHTVSRFVDSVIGFCLKLDTLYMYILLCIQTAPSW
jgi:hypothetical protein